MMRWAMTTQSWQVLLPEEELNEPIRQSVHKRLPWLIILLGLGLVVSSVVGLFEGRSSPT